MNKSIKSGIKNQISNEWPNYMIGYGQRLNIEKEHRISGKPLDINKTIG